MNQRNDFVLGGKLVFSNAGEMELIRDERFAKMLNNSLGVTLDQFQLIDAISTGSIAVENGEVTAEVIVYDEDAFFMCQPPLKPSGSNPEGRKYMLLYGVFPKNNKIRRIFIRSEDGGIEGLMGVSRPIALIRDITNRLGRDPLVAVVHRRPGNNQNTVKKSFPVKGTQPQQKPKGPKPKAEPKQTQDNQATPQSPSGKNGKQGNKPRQHPSERPASSSIGSQFPGLDAMLKGKIHEAVTADAPVISHTDAAAFTGELPDPSDLAVAEHVIVENAPPAANADTLEVVPEA